MRLFDPFSAVLDAIDRRILVLLQKDARISNADIARALDMAPSAIFERVKKLESRAVIARYETRLDAKALGFGLVAFVSVRVDDIHGGEAVAAALVAIPEALEVHHVVGDDCFLVKLRTRDTEELARVIRERFATVPGVKATRTTIVLRPLKETLELPLGIASPRRVDESASA